MKAATRLILAALIVLPVNGQDRQPYTLSVDVDMVVLNVRAVDGNGQSIHNLTKENFEVRDNGKRQSVTLFVGQDSPATIGLVLDSSSSMNSKHSEVKAGALRFIQSSHPRDQIFVMHFNDRLHWPLPHSQRFTDDINVLEQALSWNGLGGKTALYDAMAAALKHSAQGEWEKRALIVLTDGGDNASTETFERVLKLAQESNVMIYTIGLFDPLAVGNNRSALQKLARLTGGDAYFPVSIDELDPLWEEIAHGIRTQYTLGYRPDPTFVDGKFHKVQVRVDVPGSPKLHIHTRPGYLARKARL
jgi:Ca-activated chloride channel family protein